MEFLHSNIEGIRLLRPEIALCLGIFVIFACDLLFSASRSFLIVLASLTLLAVGYLLARDFTAGTNMAAFSGLLAIDGFSTFFKLFFISATLAVILLVYKSAEFADTNLAEPLIFLMVINLGMMLLASSADLLMIYLSLETISLLSYVLVGYKLDSRPSSEASLKYIIFGGVSSGVMLFGMTYLYGIFGTTNLAAIRNILLTMDASASGYPLLFASVLVLVGFGFKIAMVPFHMWCPDVYEGAPTPITAFLSVAPKAAGFAVLIRFIFAIFGTEIGEISALFSTIGLSRLLVILSIITMTVGNLAAIPQNNLKRLLAYSSIAHAGYMLMGLAALSRNGVESVLFYLPVYLAMNVGAFLIVGQVRDSTGSEDISAYRGLGRRNPYLALSMTVYLFSLTGLPPLAGFLSKFYVFAAVIERGLYILATIGVINSVISLFYYVRIVRAMFLEDFRGIDDRKRNEERLTTYKTYNILNAFFVAFNLLLIFYWTPLLEIVRKSTLRIF